MHSLIVYTAFIFWFSLSFYFSFKFFGRSKYRLSKASIPV